MAADQELKTPDEEVELLDYLEEQDETADEQIAIGILEKDDRVLMVERPVDAKEFGGMAAFPGGKVRPNENPWDACERIMHRETGLDVDVMRKIDEILQTIERNDGKTRNLLLHIFIVEEDDDYPRRHSFRSFWNDDDKLDHLDIVPSNLSIFERIYQRGETGPFVSVIEQDEHGDYRQTTFDSIEDR